MVVDASRSPVPVWKRWARFLILAGLILLIGFEIWTRELHHQILQPAHKSHPAAMLVYRPMGLS